MISIALTLVGLKLLLLAVHLLWKKGKAHGENARKAYHVAAGTFAAFWPLYMSWEEIKLLSLLMIFAVFIVRRFQLYKSVYEIERRSLGELFIPIGVFIAALFEPTTALFAIVALHIGWADGLAAVIGTRYGKSNSYNILGNKKSIAGTGTFLIVSCLILSVGLLLIPELAAVGMPTLLMLPIALAFIENISPYGSDNLLVALVLLTTLHR